MATTPTPPPNVQILFVCHPLTGHLTPTLRVAAALHARGYATTFLGPTAHRARITASGATFLPLTGAADLDDLHYYAPTNPHPPTPTYHTTLAPDERALVDLEHHCLAPLPAQWADVQRALTHLHHHHPAQPVIVIAEAFFHGILPLHLHAPLPPGIPRPRATLALSVTPPALRSAALPPFGVALPFDASAAGRARNARAWDAWADHVQPLTALWRAKLVEAGAAHVPDGPVLSGANYLLHDRILQIGVPGFEYPRADWPAQFAFAGFLPTPAAPQGGWPNLPAWWGEVVTTGAAAAAATEKTKRRVVVVAQGTVETNPHDLIIPTLEALRDRGTNADDADDDDDDVLVVAILGLRGATLPADYAVPANARVTDYLPYDAVLPFAHVWVHNGGYGAITHGVAHGVPMVVAGEGQDKPENIRRVRYSGIGVGLGSARPSVADLRASLEHVLAHKAYAERIAVLRQEMIELDCFGTIEKAVLAALE